MLKRINLDSNCTGSVQSILCSSTFFLWWLSVSDAYHLNWPELENFAFVCGEKLDDLSAIMESDMLANHAVEYTIIVLRDVSSTMNST